MPFVAIDKRSYIPISDEPNIRMGYALSGGTNAPRAIYMAISLALVKECGWEIQRSERGRVFIPLSVLEGTYEDAGFFIITPHPNGYMFGTNAKVVTESFSLTTGIVVSKFKHYVVNDPLEEKPVVTIDHSITKEGLLIELPDWFRYNEASLPERPPPTPQPDTALAQELTKHMPKASGVTQAAVDALELPPTPEKLLKLNRSERRTLAGKVARELGRR